MTSCLTIYRNKFAFSRQCLKSSTPEQRFPRLETIWLFEQNLSGGLIHYLWPLIGFESTPRSCKAHAASKYKEDHRAQAGTLAYRPSGITGSGGSMFLIATSVVSHANVLVGMCWTHLVLLLRVPISWSCYPFHSLPPTRLGLPPSRPLGMIQTVSSKWRIGTADG